MEFPRSLGRSNYEIPLELIQTINQATVFRIVSKKNAITLCPLTAREYFTKLLTFPPPKKLVKHRKFCRVL